MGGVPRLSGVLGILFWSAAAIAIARPDLTSLVANAVGINRGADLVFYLAILGGVKCLFLLLSAEPPTGELDHRTGAPRSRQKCTIRIDAEHRRTAQSGQEQPEVARKYFSPEK